MGDFLLLRRESSASQIEDASQRLRFFKDVQCEQLELGDFLLLVTSTDDPKLWGPYCSPDRRVEVALAGRIALEPEEWEQAGADAGPGGLACRAIAGSYRRDGLRALEKLNGNFVAFIHDRDQQRLFIVTDAWGAFPAFRGDRGGRVAGYGSHPDVLAEVLGQEQQLDSVSLAEFLVTGKVSFPFTYYSAVRALPYGTILSLPSNTASGDAAQEHRYASYEFAGDSSADPDSLAESLAEALRKSLRRRTLPVLGRGAVALSGGLDSRTVLHGAPEPRRLLTFCSFDEENLEFRIARAIAGAARAEFIPMRRSPDFYGENAGMGGRISGGMGCVACNHFLGFRRQLQDLGVRNLLTGCYFDYVFKGLVLDRRRTGPFQRENLAPFSHQNYEPHYWFESSLAQQVRQRLEAQVPLDLRAYRTDEDRWQVEQRRIFPLCYETDNVQRLVPQRVMGWFPPIADRDVFEVYRRIPCHMKLNRAFFVRTVQRICGDNLSDIPDANTSAPVGAPLWREALGGHWLSLQRKWMRLRNTIATNQSWPDWTTYIQKSPEIRRIWERKNPAADEFFTRVMGTFERDLAVDRGPKLGLFIHLLTLKIWFDLRNPE
jgi:asparagine synthase (glutamine-hydrolysing)